MLYAYLFYLKLKANNISFYVVLMPVMNFSETLLTSSSTTRVKIITDVSHGFLVTNVKMLVIFTVTWL